MITQEQVNKMITEAVERVKVRAQYQTYAAALQKRFGNNAVTLKNVGKKA